MVQSFNTKIRTFAKIFVGVALGLLVTSGLTLLQSGETTQELASLDSNTVITQIGTEVDPISKQAYDLLKNARENPSDVAIALTAAKQLIESGRALGDVRLVGAAQALLTPFLSENNADVLLTTAIAAQYRHDFSTALSLLRRAVAADPESIQSWLNIATLELVVGNVAKSLETCKKLDELGRADIGFLCTAAASTMRAERSEIHKTLEKAISSNAFDPSLGSWALSLAGEYARLEGDFIRAYDALTQVVTEEPNALRDRLMLVDLLIEHGDTAEALTWLRAAPQVDGVRIRLAYLSEVTDSDEVAALSEELVLNISLGNNAHAREEAMIGLLLTKDTATALSRARINWELQKEYDDARILLAAAKAAGRPSAAQPVMDWLAKEGLNLPRLERPWGALK